MDYSFHNPNSGEPLTKHWNFFCAGLQSARGKLDYRFLFLGGGVNGGKTYCVLALLLKIADEYPGCKIHIIRKSMPVLLSTTVESMRKLTGDSVEWYQDKSNYHCTLPNGSKIYFFSENFESDKDLDRFKGLETNIIFLEQIEELQRKTLEISISRVGRWKVSGKKMPAPMILSTFNPTYVKWVRNLTYIPWKNKNIPRNTYMQFITSADNPFVTEYELEMYQNMDELHKKQYIDGDWEIFTNVRSYLYSFKPDKHVTNVLQHPNQTVHVSFDFNVDPVTCILFNFDRLNNSIKIFKEIRLSNSNIHELCKQILKYKTGMGFEITGDASGRQRSVVLTENQTIYDIIRKRLNIPEARMKVPMKNLGHHDSRVVCNSVLERFSIEIDSSCESLIEDIATVETDEQGKIDKSDKSKTHFLDCFRYALHTYFLNLIFKDRWLN